MEKLLHVLGTLKNTVVTVEARGTDSGFVGILVDYSIHESGRVSVVLESDEKELSLVFDVAAVLAGDHSLEEDEDEDEEDDDDEDDEDGDEDEDE